MFQKKIKCFGMMQAKPGLRGPRADEDVEDVLSAKRARAEGMERLAALNTLCRLGAPIPADVGGGSIDLTLKAWPPVTSCLRQSFRGPSGTVFGYRATALHSQLGGREHMSHSFNRGSGGTTWNPSTIAFTLTPTLLLAPCCPG